MSRMWIALALLPLTLLAGVSSGTGNGCTYAGGDTELTPMVPANQGPGDGFYLHASADPAKSGLYAEDNGKPGLQVTDRTVNCGQGVTVLRVADRLALDYVS